MNESETAKSTQCPLLTPCYNASGINCVGRDYSQCNFFENELGRICHIKNNNCTKCGYFNVCRRPTKKGALPK